MNIADASVVSFCVANLRSRILQRANFAFAGRFMVSASVLLHFGGKPKVKPL
jgi:hypothetical protein